MYFLVVCSRYRYQNNGRTSQQQHIKSTRHLLIYAASCDTGIAKRRPLNDGRNSRPTLNERVCAGVSEGSEHAGVRAGMERCSTEETRSGAVFVRVCCRVGRLFGSWVCTGRQWVEREGAVLWADSKSRGRCHVTLNGIGRLCSSCLHECTGL